MLENIKNSTNHKAVSKKKITPPLKLHKDLAKDKSNKSKGGLQASGESKILSFEKSAKLVYFWHYNQIKEDFIAGLAELLVDFEENILNQEPGDFQKIKNQAYRFLEGYSDSPAMRGVNDDLKKITDSLIHKLELKQKMLWGAKLQKSGLSFLQRSLAGLQDTYEAGLVLDQVDLTDLAKACFELQNMGVISNTQALPILQALEKLSYQTKLGNPPSKYAQKSIQSMANSLEQSHKEKPKDLLKLSLTTKQEIFFEHASKLAFLEEQKANSIQKLATSLNEIAVEVILENKTTDLKWLKQLLAELKAAFREPNLGLDYIENNVKQLELSNYLVNFFEQQASYNIAQPQTMDELKNKALLKEFEAGNLLDSVAPNFNYNSWLEFIYCEATCLIKRGVAAPKAIITRKLNQSQLSLQPNIGSSYSGEEIKKLYQAWHELVITALKFDPLIYYKQILNSKLTTQSSLHLNLASPNLGEQIAGRHNFILKKLATFDLNYASGAYALSGAEVKTLATKFLWQKPLAIHNLSKALLGIDLASQLKTIGQTAKSLNIIATSLALEIMQNQKLVLAVSRLQEALPDEPPAAPLVKDSLVNKTQSYLHGAAFDKKKQSLFQLQMSDIILDVNPALALAWLNLLVPNLNLAKKTIRDCEKTFQLIDLSELGLATNIIDKFYSSALEPKKLPLALLHEHFFSKLKGFNLAPVNILKVIKLSLLIYQLLEDGKTYEFIPALATTSLLISLQIHMLVDSCLLAYT